MGLRKFLNDLLLEVVEKGKSYQRLGIHPFSEISVGPEVQAILEAICAEVGHDWAWEGYYKIAPCQFEIITGDCQRCGEANRDQPWR